jgi:hypothetical protein
VFLLPDLLSNFLEEGSQFLVRDATLLDVVAKGSERFTHAMDLSLNEPTNIGGHVLPGSGRTLAQTLLLLRAQRDRKSVV